MAGGHVFNVHVASASINAGKWPSTYVEQHSVARRHLVVATAQHDGRQTKHSGQRMLGGELGCQLFRLDFCSIVRIRKIVREVRLVEKNVGVSRATDGND